MDSTTDNITSEIVNEDGESVALAVTRAVTKFFFSYVLMISIVVGIFGNCFSMTAFWLRRNQDKISATYLGPLAFFDLWNICQSLHQWLISAAEEASNGLIKIPPHQSETSWGCKLLIFGFQFPLFMSGWIIVCFTLERALVIHFPFKMASILTFNLRRKVLFSIVIASLLIHLVALNAEPFEYDGVKFCPPRADSPKMLIDWYWVVTFGFDSLFPCFSLVLLNIAILIGVLFPKDKVESHNPKQAKNEQRILKNIIAVSCFYCLFVFPYPIFQSLVVFTDMGKNPVAAELANFCIAWISLNASINSMLYVWSLPHYRQFLVKTFCPCCLRQKTAATKSNGQQTTVT